MTIDDAAVPLPTAELMRRAAELSPKQREVLDALDSFPDGALLSELGKELGIHVNTVRGHVDELAERGLVGWRVASRSTRGRPSHVYHVRTPQHHAVMDEYVTLVETLTETLAGDDLNAARDFGRAWAQRNADRFGEPPEDFEELATAVLRSLREMGFDPLVREADGDTSVEVGLQACPFVAADGTPPAATICALHQGFIDATIGPHHLDFMPFDAAGQCGARLVNRSASRSD
ncbi:transcriptional regulator [Corynebacterium sp. MC-17D]|uniref:Transcriptional regulator n=1 Tax=Corynebacterium lipophilum TaxID=2804918 RepID=A0AAW5HTX3_9CORY|nr:transcriptional regulator [Corynebacterium lipophilum]MCO6394327.1 transcriptional regulator [Corynebacterium lipophilum]MCZ2116951.1 transcriptional regulator [Corynebacterium lipophilum]